MEDLNCKAIMIINHGYIHHFTSNPSTTGSHHICFNSLREPGEIQPICGDQEAGGKVRRKKGYEALLDKAALVAENEICGTLWAAAT